MQTFLPEKSIIDSVRVLDNRRLGKQRVEARQLLTLLKNGTQTGWAHHPAAKMWRGYEDALGWYYNCCLDEWEHRGFRNNMVRVAVPFAVKLPKWFYGPIHQSHREALVYKAAVKMWHKSDGRDWIWYNQFSWQVSPDLSEVVEGKPFAHYYWPVR